MWNLIREHIKAFWTGFIAGGVPTAVYVLRVPDLPHAAWLGHILKGTQIVLFSTASGLFLTVATDIYKHYLKHRIISRIDKIIAFIKRVYYRIYKNIKYVRQQKRKGDKAA